jgi:imidazolonepropionase-like amidohydrolase
MASSVLRGVRVYRDGRFGDPEDVIIDGSVIGTDATGAPDAEVAETGGYLIPGLIDAHVHVETLETLATFAGYGITTVLDMANPMAKLTPLRGQPGVADLRAAGVAATSPESAHAKRMNAGPIVLVASPADADGWVQARVDEGADYIKIVIDLPGFDQETVDAFVAAAHARGKKVVAHGSRSDAVAMAQAAGVDVLTHAPLDKPIDASQAAALAAAGAIIVPTLAMMEGLVEGLKRAGIPGPVYEPARASVAALHEAGVPIVAGTDANAAPAAPSSPPFGDSLHHEFELLLAAGLSPAEILDAATSLAADHFDLGDRGRIRPGFRADLVLLDADPLADITATRSIRAVWVAGQRI